MKNNIKRRKTDIISVQSKGMRFGVEELQDAVNTLIAKVDAAHPEWRECPDNAHFSMEEVNDYDSLNLWFQRYMTEEELAAENMKQSEFKHRAVDSLKMLISSNPEETKKLLQLMDEGVDIRKLKTRDIVGDE